MKPFFYILVGFILLAASGGNPAALLPLGLIALLVWAAASASTGSTPGAFHHSSTDDSTEWPSNSDSLFSDSHTDPFDHSGTDPFDHSGTDLLGHSSTMGAGMFNELDSMNSCPGVNPANGLPMVDSSIDIAGNLYGTDSSSSFDSSFEDPFSSSFDDSFSSGGFDDPFS